MKVKSVLFALLGLAFVLPASAAVNPEDTIHAYYYKGVKLMEKQRAPEAEPIFFRYMALCKEHELCDRILYSNALNYVALMASGRGHFDEAIRYTDEAIAIRRSAKDSNRFLLAEVLNNQSINYSHKADYDRSIEYAEEALELYRLAGAERRGFFAIALNNLAAFHFSRGNAGDVDISVRYATEAIKYIKKNTRDYVNAASSLVVYYSQTGEVKKANELSGKILKSGKKIFGENSIDYANILTNMAIRLANVSNFMQAIDVATEAMGIYEAGDIRGLRYGKLLMNMAGYYAHSEKYVQSIELLERAKEIVKEISGETGSDYMHCLSELSSAYYRLGNLEKADHYTALLQRIVGHGEKPENRSPKFAKALSKQAEIYAANGDFSNACKTEQSALDLYCTFSDTVAIANSYNLLSNYLFHAGNLEQAFESCRQSIDLYQRLGDMTTDCARAFNNMSVYHYYRDDVADALDYAKRSVQIYEQKEETENTFYAKILGNEGLYYFRLDSLEQAVDCTSRSLDLLQNILGENHPDNIVTLYNLSNYYYKQGDRQKTQDYFHKALQSQKQLVRQNFSHLTTAAREMYWNTKNYVFKIAPTFAFLLSDNDSTLIDAYDAQLFTKGILLNSEVDFRSLLMTSADATLIGKYNELIKLNKQIEHLYANISEEGEKEIEAIRSQTLDLERDIINGCKEYGDFTSNMSVTVDSVSAALGAEDVAVEFIDLDLEDGNKAYAALYLRKGWKSPKFVNLFTNKQLQEIRYDGKDFFSIFGDIRGVDSIYTDKRVGQLVWGTLMKQWNGVKNVYFAPTALFYQWGIEYLKIDDDRTIADVYSLHRLSSTKLLAQKKREKKKIETASVFGGLDYDLDVETMAQNHSRRSDYSYALLASADEDDRRSVSEANDAAADSLMLRSGASYLPGTLQEATQIGEQLMQADISTDMYLEGEGTEEAFKALSGKGRSLIHIATHGFNFTEHEVKRSRSVAFLSESGSQETDKSMNYSGLLLAGANNILTRAKLPEGVENGILTAKEISVLNFSRLDLVVLSACQTGMGEIREDGVFGLQRGFKKAGAATLLMSLWSVSDRATQAMMTSFYGYLMKGHSRHDAFLMAQEDLRQQGFGRPFYWASFIMLDDIE